MAVFYSLHLGVTNVYLLKANEGYLLIDTGYPQDYQRFLNALGDVELSSIRYLLLTHHHDDHAGFAAELVKRTECRIIAHQNSVEHLGVGFSLAANRPLNSCVWMLSKLLRLVHPKPEYPRVVLLENDILISGDSYFLKEIGIDGVIIETPGHTSDSLSVILSDGSAFVGDAVVNMLLPCTRYRPFVVENMDLVYASWRKLRDYGARVIYPSHGKPFSIEVLERRV